MIKNSPDIWIRSKCHMVTESGYFLDRLSPHFFVETQSFYWHSLVAPPPPRPPFHSRTVLVALVKAVRSAKWYKSI